jgi:hypothetical protein
MTRKNNLVCLSSISLADPVIDKKTVRADVRIHEMNGTDHRFEFVNTYEHQLQDYHLPLLRLAFCMPLLNYGLFTKKIQLNFPISTADLALLNELDVVFSRDIFVNKIAHGDNPYILPEFFPDANHITPQDGDPKATIVPATVTADVPITTDRKSTRLNSSH